MKLLYIACLRNPEDFERWLVPYLEREATVYPFDYRSVANSLDEKILKTVKLLDIDSVLFMKAESVKAETIQSLNEVGINTGCWTIDDHAHPELFQKPFTHIWTPSPGLIDDYKKRHKHVHELAFYVEPALYTESAGDFYVPIPREVSFLGTRYEGREERITQLRQAGIDVQVYGDQWGIQNSGRLREYSSCVALWHDSKVNLNIHQQSMVDLGALNTKMYEIPAAGGFMVTDYFPEVLERFAADEVAIYDRTSDSSLLEVVKRYLANDKERLGVIERARKRVLTEHTSEKRVEQILREFK